VQSKHESNQGSSMMAMVQLAKEKGNKLVATLGGNTFFVDQKSLQQRKLKIAIVFIHETCSFEVWLAGYNKQNQAKYWKLLKESGWNKYQLVSTTEGVDSILEHSLVDKPDFSDLEALTTQIETEALKFIKNVESFLSKHSLEHSL
jgi:hypothetical protein